VRDEFRRRSITETLLGTDGLVPALPLFELTILWTTGGVPPFLCKCSFQARLSPMILQVRIPKDLRADFS